MKFVVSNTESRWDEEKKPCRGAVKEKYTRIDERTTYDPALVPAAKGESAWWYEEGTNHRVERNRIMRDFDDETWFIELNTLEELLELAEVYGFITIHQCYNNHALTEIEIQ